VVSNPFADDKAPKKKKMKGYAFIVFEREADMKGSHSQLNAHPPKPSDQTKLAD
jgi:hypothetical protein